MIVRRCHNGDYWDPLPMRVVFIYDHSIDETAGKRFQDMEYQMIRGRE